MSSNCFPPILFLFTFMSFCGFSELNPITPTPTLPKAPSNEPAPYNGFGSEEDSLTSCHGLEPKPPQRDFDKFIYKDRYKITQLGI